MIIIANTEKYGYNLNNSNIRDSQAMSSSTKQNHAFSLSSAKQGDFVRVVDVKADNLLKKRLVSMGVLMNSRLRIIQRRGGALVVGFDASRIAIGAGMSQHILVKAI